MTYIEKPKRKCRVCKKEYLLNKKYSQTQKASAKYCSNECKFKRYIEKKPLEKKICLNCNKECLINRKNFKFCSRKCSAEYSKINDGMTKYERYSRRKGMVKKGTPEWLEKIKSTTKDAMKKPEIREKLKKPRKPMSLERRIQKSNELAGKLPKNMMFGGSGNFPNVQRGDYECSKGTMYFRSKWEANYALYLDFLVEKNEIKNWEYEADVFMFEEIKLGTRSYRPDFKVFTTNGLFEYHEVKGYMDSKSKTKLKRMAKYYPEVKIILVDAPVYNGIKKQVGKMLNFY